MLMIGKASYYLVRKRILSGCPLETLINDQIKEREETKNECN